MPMGYNNVRLGPKIGRFLGQLYVIAHELTQKKRIIARPLERGFTVVIYLFKHLLIEKKHKVKKTYI